MNTFHRLLGLVVLVPGILLISATPTLFAQSTFENTIVQFNAETVSGYIQPFADLYGAAISNGSFHSAAIADEGFHIRLDLIGMASAVKDEQKSYTANMPQSFSQRTSVQPTILGGQGTLVVDQGTGFQYKGSSGIFNASAMGYGTLQLTVGSIFGTEGFIRYATIPASATQNLPTQTLIGGGLRHSISRYLNEFPLDLAVAASYNRLELEDITTIDGVLVSAQASKNFEPLTIYGGVSWEESKMTLDYTTTGSNGEPVNIELDGANTFRATIGLGLQFGFLGLFADANFGTVSSFAGGISLGM